MSFISFFFVVFFFFLVVPIFSFFHIFIIFIFFCYLKIQLLELTNIYWEMVLSFGPTISVSLVRSTTWRLPLMKSKEPASLNTLPTTCLRVFLYVLLCVHQLYFSQVKHSNFLLCSSLKVATKFVFFLQWLIWARWITYLSALRSIQLFRSTIVVLIRRSFGRFHTLCL